MIRRLRHKLCCRQIRRTRRPCCGDGWCPMETGAACRPVRSRFGVARTRLCGWPPRRSRGGPPPFAPVAGYVLAQDGLVVLLTQPVPDVATFPSSGSGLIDEVIEVVIDSDPNGNDRIVNTFQIAVETIKVHSLFHGICVAVIDAR